MFTSFSCRCTSALAGIILFFSFASAQAADTLGAWKAQDVSSGDYKINGMAFGNNTYVIVGVDNAKCCKKSFIATSFDALNWTIRPTGSGSDEFNSVIFSKGRFIAVCTQPETGNARIWISDNNGTSWSTKSSDNGGIIVPGGLHSIASDGNGKLVAVGGVKSLWSYGWITVSADNGSTWRVVRGAGGLDWWVTGKLYEVGYAKGNWYAFTSSGSYKSTDAGTTSASWTLFSLSGVDTVGLGPKVASSSETVVVAVSGGPKWSRDNGATWIAGVQAKGFEGVSSLTSAASSVIYEDGTFVLATRYSGDVWTSENGQIWKRWTLPVSAGQAYTLCYGQKTFWCAGPDNSISKSPPWFKARLGCSTDYPFTLFDAEDGPPNRIGLPQYRVNTASLNLVLEGTLFYGKTLGTPINMKLIYNSKPTVNGDSSIGPFGKNWRFRYESVVGRFGQDAQLVNGGGRSFAFSTPKGEDLEFVATDVTLKAPDGIFDTLKYYKSGTPSPRFELTLKSSHITYIYGTMGTTAGVNQGIFYLTGIKDEFGNTTTLTVNAGNGQITAINDPASRTFTFHYLLSGLCDYITMPDGRKVYFTYDATSKALTKIKDMWGYEGNYIYDAKGFLTSMSTAGKTTTFTYKDRPGYEAASGAVENAGDKYLSSITRPSVGETKYELLDEGATVKRTSPSGEVTLISNKEGQTTSVKDPLGNVRNTTFNDAKLPQTVTDEKGGVFTYEYDAFGNMTKQTDAMGKSTTYVYDASSNLITVTNAIGKVWTYTYDFNTAKYQPLTITTPTPLSNVTRFTYYGVGAKNGRLEGITDARGYKTSFDYDANGYGNLIAKTTPEGGTATLGYEAAKGFRCVSMTDPNGNTKAIAWDDNDRLTSVTYTSVTGSPSYTNEYDAFGQTKFKDEMYPVTNKSTDIVRDDLGFITSLTDPLGNVTRKEYDADSRPSKTIDPLGRMTSTSYDNAGRPILFTDARGFKIVKEYDGVGNLVSFMDKNGAETKYVYDKNNRLITTTDPLKKVATITRDDLGRTSSIKNARLQTITNTYDEDGRLTKKALKLTASSAPTTLVENTLDPNGNILTQKDAWGTTTYVYDKNNRVTNITYPDGKSVGLTYNLGGNIARITYPDGLVVNYTYDKFNRQPVPSILKNNPGTDLVGESRLTNAIKSITISGVATAYGLTYNNRGNILNITRPNGIQTDYAYDPAGRIIQVKHSETLGGANLFTANYFPDAVGNISSESLTGSNYYLSTQSLVNTTLLYNVAGELTKKGGKACTSDVDGNLIDLEAGTLKCTYDAENRLTKMVRKALDKTITTTENTYNADGLRVKRVVIGDTPETTFYHYLPSGVMLFTTDVNGTIVDRHIYAGNALLSTYDANGDWLYYFSDRQGHVRFVADDTAAVIAKYDYLPYGQVSADPANTLTNNPFTYVGGFGVQDEGNEIFYMKNRFYDANSGRFLQRDPIGFEGGSNLYAYANENPLRYIDPNGTASLGEWTWWGLGQAVKITVAVAAGAAAVAYVPVAVGTGIAIGGAVYAGEVVIQALYEVGHNPLVQESQEFNRNKQEFDIDRLDQLDREKARQDELIKKTKDAVGSQTGDISAAL